MNLNQLSPEKKLIIIIVIILPLFMLIFYDMGNQKDASSTYYYKCPNGTVILLNKDIDYLCGDYSVSYNNATKKIVRYDLFYEDPLYSLNLNWSNLTY